MTHRRVRRNIAGKRDSEGCKTGNNLGLLSISVTTVYVSSSSLWGDSSYYDDIVVCRFLNHKLKNTAIICEMPVCNIYRTDKPRRIQRHAVEFFLYFIDMFSISKK
jgi:hypothetical protein